MNVYIHNINAWLQGLDNSTDLTLWAKTNLPLPASFIPPKPSYYPKGQLRRLSPFSKVALHCLDIPTALEQDLPLIFASQHGDLAKTVELIKAAALAEDLSPTQFALSVHNATTGLFSIAANNSAATTTISAGSATFIEGLIEAAMQCQQENTPVIYCYCDFDVPAEYQDFAPSQPARCLTMIITSDPKPAAIANLTLAFNNTLTRCETNPPLDLCVTFMRYFYQQNPATFSMGQYDLTLDFN